MRAFLKAKSSSFSLVSVEIMNGLCLSLAVVGPFEVAAAESLGLDPFTRGAVAGIALSDD